MLAQVKRDTAKARKQQDTDENTTLSVMQSPHFSPMVTTGDSAIEAVLKKDVGLLRDVIIKEAGMDPVQQRLGNG